MQPLVLRLVPGHQLAVLSGILQRLALCQDTGPGLMRFPAYLGHELLPGQKRAQGPQCLQLPALKHTPEGAASLSITYLRARTVWRYCR